jgi:3',5'-cyclic AMP phosphodiesterase CpdA
VTRPFLLAHLSDPHIGADWADADSLAGLAKVVDSVRAIRPGPDAVLVSGDLADHATDAEYEQVKEVLTPLQAPVYVLAGNHDDRRALHRHFNVPGANGEALQYSVELGPIRLIALDTARPGEDPGELGSDRLAWLDAELASAPELPTLVAMHHPPFATGVPIWDELGLPAADRRALAEVIERHPQVRRLVSGHVHRTISGQVAGRPALVVPSTYVQARLTIAGNEIELSDDPPGFAVHVVVDGEVISHVQPVY